MITIDDEAAALAPIDEREFVPAVEEQQKRKVRGLTRDEWLEYAMAFAAGAHLAVLLRFLLDWDDLMGTALIVLVTFVGIHYLIVRERSTPEVAIDKTVTTVMWTVGLVLVGVLVWMVTFVTVKGLDQLRPSFLTSDLEEVGPLEEGGGALHAIIGTAEQVGIATLFVVPISILTAVYLHEIKGRMAGIIRFIVDALSGMPSIVAGLLIYTVWPIDGYSGVQASAALLILAIPIVTRGAEEVLRTVSDGLRESSLALGAPQWRVVLFVVLPTAQAGILTVTLLALARMVGETAPVILTALGNSAINKNPFDGPQAALSWFVYDLIRVPNERQNARAWAGALLLLIIVLIVFVAARVALARSERRLGRR
jgi:phosphate transport system permease protein